MGQTRLGASRIRAATAFLSALFPEDAQTPTRQSTHPLARPVVTGQSLFVNCGAGPVNDPSARCLRPEKHPRGPRTGEGPSGVNQHTRDLRGCRSGALTPRRNQDQQVIGIGRAIAVDVTAGSPPGQECWTPTNRNAGHPPTGRPARNAGHPPNRPHLHEAAAFWRVGGCPISAQERPEYPHPPPPPCYCDSFSLSWRGRLPIVSGAPT